MPEDKDKEKDSGFKPPKYVKTTVDMLKSMVTGWIFFNLVLVIAGFLIVRLGNVNTWPYQVALATWLTHDRFINPMNLVTGTLRYQNVELLDTDADGELERVLFYRYDVVSGRSPYGATVLDLNHCRPRGLDSFELIPLDRDYLSESRYELEIRDIPDVGGAHDVLVWGKTPDNIRTELAVFYWYDYSEPCTPPAAGLKGYLNLGAFRGSGGIQIEGSKVRVKDRAFERSQLAVTRVYEPRNGTYRQSQAGPLLDPVAKAVEFTFGPPTPVPETYYPEKSVLAFYLYIGINTEEAKKLLDPAVMHEYIDGNWGKNVAEPGQLTSMAEVKEIAYYPDVEKERLHGEIAVDVELANRRPDGTITGPHRYRVWVRGFARQGAFPYDCEWRIFKFEPLL